MKKLYNQVLKTINGVSVSSCKEKSKLRSGLIMLLFLIFVTVAKAQDCGTGDTITLNVDTNINGLFTVLPGDVLQIEPGVNINFETQDSKLSIEGTILAQGTEELPINFSGLLTDGWSGIDFTNACPSQFIYCNFSGINRGGAKRGDLRAVSGIDITNTDNVLFENCNFSENNDGIGINNSIGVVMSSCSFFENEILPGQKGMIFIEGSSSDTIRNCEFVDNKTNLRGIISANNGSSVVIQNNLFQKTRFFEPIFNGTIYSVINLKNSDAPNLLVVNSNRFSGSKAPEGNRLCEISIFGNQNDIDNTNVLIWNNTFTGYPFPLPGQTPKTAVRANYSVLTITHNTISFYNHSGIELLVSEAKINLNAFSSNFTTAGAVYLDEYTGYTGREINNVIFANTFTNNTAENGPAILSTVLPNENIITTIEQNLFSGNEAADDGGRGGAVYDFYGSRMNIVNNVFEQNSAGRGGAICIESNAAEETVSKLIKDNQFTGNMVSGPGGAVYAEGSMISFEKNEIKGNHALIGGGIYLDGSVPAFSKSSRAESNFVDNVFSDNTYSQAGGGCYLLNCQDVDLVRNLFSFNTPDGTSVDQFGGGIYAINSSLNFYNCNFVENTASVNFGGAIYLSLEATNSFVLQNCNIAGHNDAGGVVIESPVTAGNIQVYNSLFYENNQGATGKAFVYTGAEAIDLYNCYFDVLPSESDLNFVDELVNTSPGWIGSGSYYLDCDNAVCIDSGNPDATYNDLPGANPDEALFPSCGTLTNDIGISGGPFALDIPELFQPVSSDHSYTDDVVMFVSTKEEISFSAYPNPTAGRINISTNLTNAKNASVMITDVYGRLVQEIKVSDIDHEVNVNLAGKPSGIYIVKLISGNQVCTGTIMLQ